MKSVVKSFSLTEDVISDLKEIASYLRETAGTGTESGAIRTCVKYYKQTVLKETA